ncbi:hypothetical protein BDW75DRAFT_235643 [Aspergillus navahoensis]
MVTFEVPYELSLNSHTPSSCARRDLSLQPPPLASLYSYCQTKFWRDPHSAFFQEDDVYDLDYSLYREREAWHFISRHNATVDPPDYTRGALGRTPICVAMVTVRRELDTYFEASVGSLLEGLTERERRALYLSVLFADTDPAVHPSWGQKWVGRLVDEAGTYNVSTGQLEHLRMLERQRNFYEKGNVNASYTIIFEDDIILPRGVELDQVQVRTRPWLYLRLFYTETALGWSDVDAAYRNMPLIVTMFMASTFCFLLLLRRSPRFQLLHLDILSILVISLLCVPEFTALVYMVGKYSLMPLRGVVQMNKSGCCTQGLLFPAQQVDGLMAFLEARGHGQTDSMIEEYAELNRLRRYAVAPPLLQHVGLKSSRDNLDVNTQSTWAFWFETNEPGVLRKEHAELLGNADVQEMLETRLDRWRFDAKQKENLVFYKSTP